MNMTTKKRTVVYTDGACLGNPGPGGWAAVILRDGQETHLSGGDPYTTNNRMELAGVIRALEELYKAGSQQITVVTDSRYVCDAFNQHWVDSWRQNDWTRSGGELKNADLWKRLDFLTSEHQCIFRWVRGHAGNRYNELCDQLAGIEARKAIGRRKPEEHPHTPVPEARGCWQMSLFDLGVQSPH